MSNWALKETEKVLKDITKWKKFSKAWINRYYQLYDILEKAKLYRC